MNNKKEKKSKKRPGKAQIKKKYYPIARAKKLFGAKHRAEA